MRKLPIEYRDIYKEFMKGKFVVKTHISNFNGVSPDIKLEQTAQRSKSVLLALLVKLGNYHM